MEARSDCKLWGSRNWLSCRPRSIGAMTFISGLLLLFIRLICTKHSYRINMAHWLQQTMGPGFCLTKYTSYIFSLELAIHCSLCLLSTFYGGIMYFYGWWTEMKMYRFLIKLKFRCDIMVTYMNVWSMTQKCIYLQIKSTVNALLWNDTHTYAENWNTKCLHVFIESLRSNFYLLQINLFKK